MSKPVDLKNQQQLSFDFGRSEVTIQQYELDKSNVINFKDYAETRNFEIKTETVEERLLHEAKKLRW